MQGHVIVNLKAHFKNFKMTSHPALFL